ncbi:MAG: hypothetical protein ABIH42_10205 [Planctomycetota bacterium]
MTKSKTKERVLLNREIIREKITLLAKMIAGDGKDIESLAIVGIRRRGVPLAQRISDEIDKLYGKKNRTGNSRYYSLS